MRKLLGIIAALCIAMTTPALAYDVDLKALSDEEILQLKEDITSEIGERGLSISEIFHPGTYEIGKDIASGRYLFIPDSGNANVIICETLDDFKNEEFSIIHYLWKSDNDSAVVDLTDGQLLVITNGDALVSVAEKSAFAP